ncbi:hypothetical protein HUN01_05360 [Nostoc edaphicum CCNP1411]|uniref:Uncharacterized protein n=1 Tax=Nostoc edaphicum CCNP1411 TaxID=1472755 RepID=A0A7D7LB71_9NOSO|nr:hypothetical protein [Nostoc edaphicum]QMS87029.1 hypothetical protein HUN01_05360 [Nostoc edaphicum CCNP1411]
MWQPDPQELLIFFIVIILSCFLGGAIAGIATLMITSKRNFYIEIFRLLIGAIAGYEAVVIFFIFNLEDKNPNKILKFIISAHENLTGFGFLIPSMLGVIGASIAIFTMRKVFSWRS